MSGGRTLAVVIATRDRPVALRATLAALAAVEPVAGWRIALRVVDNGATPSAGPVVDAAAGAAARMPGLDVALLREARQGLARARNRALVPDPPEAEAVAIIDDDVIVPEDYLARAVTLLDARPEIGLFGGRVTLHDPRDLPVTVLLRTEPRVLGPDVDVFGFLHGCNMLVRNAVFARIGAFDERLGAGTPTRAAEDTDFCYRAWRAGFGVAYAPELSVAHAHGRRDPAVEARLKEGYAMGAGAFYAKHVLFGGDAHMLRRLWRRLRRDRNMGPEKTAAWPWLRRGAAAYLRSRLAGS